MVPSLGAELQPKVFLLHQVEVAAGEVEQPLPAGLLLVSKYMEKQQVSSADSMGEGDSGTLGSCSSPSLPLRWAVGCFVTVPQQNLTQYMSLLDGMGQLQLYAT